MKKIFVIIGIIGLLIFISVVIYYSGNNTATSNPKVSQPGQPVGPDQPEALEPNPALDREPDYKASISISSYGFSPSDLTVREGDVLQLSIVSVDSQKHTFAFSKKIVGVGPVAVEAGQTEIIKFIVPPAGEYGFSCLEPGHEKETGRMTVVSRNQAASETNSPAAGETQPAMPTYRLMLSVSSQGYYPKEFTVNANQPVELTILPVDNGQHSFKFVQPVGDLGAIAMEKNKNNLVKFQAPAKGVYEFLCPEPGHDKEKGKMIVN